MKKQSRTLSTKDDVSHNESLRMIKHFRSDDISGLILPVDYAAERQANCGFCGHDLASSPTGFYFNERFHQKCINKMKNGEKNS